MRVARENPTWGYTRLRGALKNLGHELGRNTIKRILAEHGIAPTPERGRSMSWIGRQLRTSAMQAGLTTRCLTFRDIFVCMSVEVHRDGRRIEQRGELGKKSESSNVIGNLRSRPRYRKGAWQREGIPSCAKTRPS